MQQNVLLMFFSFLFFSCIFYRYQFGFRDAVVDYNNDKIYCWRDKSNFIGKCKEIPLVRISLFGVLLQHNNKKILLCPQPACGQPMVINTELCKFTPYGPACVKCSTKLGGAEVAEIERFKSMDHVIWKCTVCTLELKKASSIYYYGPDIFLCSSHHSRHMMNALKARAQSKGSRLTTDETRQQIIEIYKQQKKDKIDRKKNLWKKQLAQSKLNRSKRR